MDADARKVLEMMLQEKAIGSKKLNTLTEMMMSDGRLRGSTMYYGAPATGRWSGRGPQPQNLPRPPKLYTTNTDALYEIIMRRDVPGLVAVVEAENEARKAKKLVDRLLLVDLLAAMLRGCLCARDGYVFIMADYNAIEARCVAWMANDEAAVQAFQAADRGVGADPYCIMAGRIYNRLVTKKDETERQVGKCVELGCLAADTLVLTRARGWVPIVYVTKYDVVWDGRDWVNQEGVVLQGVKPVINLCGVFLTPDHEVRLDICEDYTWYPAGEIAEMLTRKMAEVRFAPADIPVECYLQSQEYLTCRIPTNSDFRETDAVYDIVNAGPRHCFTVLSNRGPMLVHNCGYGLGWKRLGDYAKLQGVDMVGMGLDPLYVNEQYRDAHSAICGRKVKDAVYSLKPDECRPAVRKGGLWKELEAACRSAINGRPAESHGIRYEKVGDHVYCTLHSGRKLLYRNMSIVEMVDQWGRMRPAIVYDKPRVKKHEDEDEDSDDTAMDAVRATTWGGKLVENCTIHSTLVLTQRGWVPISDVRITDLVWDGVEWVNQGGVLYRGKRHVMALQGVGITPDHRVWTTKGWEYAASYKGYNRAKIWVPDGIEVRRIERPTFRVGYPVRVRESDTTGDPRILQDETEIMRMQTVRDDRQRAAHAWDVAPSRLCGVALYDRPLQIADASRMAQLRGEGCESMPRLAGGVREFLGGYGSDVCKGLDAGSTRQQQAHQSHGYFPRWSGTDGLPTVGGIGDKVRHSNKSIGSWVAVGTIGRETELCEEDVFDLANCGPRHRFTILTNDGPLLVHNCDQADCRDLLAASLVEEEYIREHTVLTVHDEIILEVPEGDADAAMRYLVIGMTRPKHWSHGFPLKAEAVKSKVYGKGKAILTAVDGEIR